MRGPAHCVPGASTSPGVRRPVPVAFSSNGANRARLRMLFPYTEPTPTVGMMPMTGPPACHRKSSPEKARQHSQAHSQYQRRLSPEGNIAHSFLPGRNCSPPVTRKFRTCDEAVVQPLIDQPAVNLIVATGNFFVGIARSIIRRKKGRPQRPATEPLLPRGALPARTDSINHWYAARQPPALATWRI